MRIRTKLSMAVGLLILVVVVTLGFITYLSSRSALEKSILQQIKREKTDVAIAIQNMLTGVKNDVLFLTDLPPVQGIIRTQGTEAGSNKLDASYAMWVERLQQIFVSLLKNHPQYWQVRYIDEQGWERVRVDSDGQTIKIIPAAELQNKAARTYFTKTMQLPPRELYVSPLELNREHGQIEVPYKPTLHFATPVFDSSGNRKGILVINLHGKNILERVTAPQGNIYLVNQDGFFLKHPDPTREFGFDLGTNFRLRDIHPTLMEEMKEADEGVGYGIGGAELGGETFIRGFKKIYYDPQTREHYWAVVFQLPSATAFTPVYTLERLFLGVGFLIVLVGILAGYLWAGQFAKPVLTLATAAKQLEAGDLTATVPATTHTDELGTLTRVFQQMLESLRIQIREILEGVNVLASSASEIVVATSQLATGATETATAIRETTTTVNTVKQSAHLASQKAKQVAENAQHVVQVSQTGKKAIEETIAGIERIREQMTAIADSIIQLNEQSQTIGEIIATVDDIAEQSNLLAVNAAIEAAKAGEQGEGFRIVAQEIRVLADQSRQATTRVREILNDIQQVTSRAVMAAEQGDKMVEGGVHQSLEADKVIRMLTGSIGEAAQATMQIAVGSQQQAEGVNQIVEAMESIKQASEQNITSAGQLEEEARNLETLGRRLQELVARYKV